MDDLISRQAAIKEIEDLMQRYRQIDAECDRDGALFARERIKKSPAVDAIPVEWLKQYAPEKWATYMQAAVEIIIEAWQKEKEAIE